MIFLEADASQVEARVELMFTRDKKMIELARTPPWEIDMHAFNAEIIFKVPADEIKRRMKSSDPAVAKKAADMRYFGKKANHAFQRGMGPQRLSDLLLMEGVVRTKEECDGYLRKLASYYAPIEEVYFPDIRRMILKHRGLVNTWGRTWTCDYRRMDDDLYRDAYSFPPQSENADLTIQWGFIPTFEFIRRERLRARINVTVHDSLLVSCLPQDAFTIADFIRRSIERPRIYYNEPMTVPMEFKLGSTWAGDVEFKRLPSREEFTAAAYEVEARMKRAA